MQNNDATRIIGVIDNRIEKKVKALGTTETTWGEVCEVSADGKFASAYLYGDEVNPSAGFRIPGSLAVSVGDIVKVAWDGRGERWVYDVALASEYKKVSINPNTGEILVGDGTAPPAPMSFDYEPLGTVAAHEAAADPHPQYHKDGDTVQAPSIELTGGDSFIDFKNSSGDDYDARILYGSALGNDDLNVAGKRLRANQGLITTGLEATSPGNRIASPSGYTVPTSGSVPGAVEVYNPDTGTGDAYISFHNPGRYAAHLGLDGASNELFWGGWSRGAKYTVHTDANAQRGWRFYPEDDHAILAQAFGSAQGYTNIATGHAGAVAVQLFIYSNSNSNSASNYMLVWSGQDSGHHKGYAFPPPSVGYYGGGQQVMVPVNGSGWIGFSMSHGLGSVSCFIYCIGYWMA